ncbi:carboxypeptidase-like regulatory domain-containing protein [Flavobacteriaceae bacterium]|jgi:hypothetical protein|nr:carboxypeptidase-like regulatory domain-containing protein [Flavobacteriaceae bacterium]MDG1310267.1 carboxypeptidase-like regulatory domain-containing protein [Flavobacteriaceae bacterium]
MNTVVNQYTLLKYIKMRLIIVFFITSFCYSQNHVIVDSKTKEPIAYANIKFIKEDGGRYSNDKGVFKIKNNIKDSIQISCLGFSSITREVSNLKDTIFLVPDVQKIKEVVIQSGKSKLKKIGFKKSNLNWFGSANIQLGLLIKPTKENENTHINSILIPVKNKHSNINKDKIDKNFNSIIKMSVFSVKNDLPHEILVEAPITIKCNQNTGNIIEVDISNEYVQLEPTGVFVCIEMVGEVSNGVIINQLNFLPALKFTNKKTKDFTFFKSFVKPKTSNSWHEFDYKKMGLDKQIFLALKLMLSTYKE